MPCKMWLLRVIGRLGVILLLALYVILWVKVAQWLGAEPKLSSWGINDWGSPGIWFVACFVAMIPLGTSTHHAKQDRRDGKLQLLMWRVSCCNQYGL